MTTVRLTASKVEDSNVWMVEPTPQAVHVRPSGQWVYGYPEAVARRLAVAWNASLTYSVVELEAGVIATEHDALEYAIEKIRLLEIIAKGCKLHPSHRTKRKPQTWCKVCDHMWKASLALREMSAGSLPPRRIAPMTTVVEDGVCAVLDVALQAAHGFTEEKPQLDEKAYMEERRFWAEVTSREPGLHQVNPINQRKALVEEKPVKGAESS